MSIVLGIDHARVVVSGTVETIIDLPLTNSNGRQIEDYVPITIRHEVQNLNFSNPQINTLEVVLGYKIGFTFSHSDFIQGSNVEVFNSILKLHKAGATLTLIPRIDQDWRQFEVIPDNQTLSLGINSGGYDAMNNGWVFRFITKNLESDLKLQVAVAEEDRNYPYGDENFEEVLYAV